MAAEWQQHTLGELCSLITDGKHGDCRNEAGSGYYFLSVKDVFDGRMVYDNARQITQPDFNETHRRTNLMSGDILFTNTGTIGRMAIAPDDPKTTRTTFQKSVAILKPKREFVLPHFLYYVLHFDNARLSDYAAGTTQKNLLLKDLRAFSVSIPPLAEQKAIAAVLGALDDKIELNRRMNATLEALARALFQSWFVDFDPVRAKLDGRQPTCLDARTAALFPNEFDDSELGPVPEGWRVGKVSDAFNLTMGQSPPGNTYNEDGDGMPLYQGRTDFGFRFPTRRVFCTAPTRLAKRGDTLVSVRAPVGDINMADEECCVGRGVAAVRHKSGAISFTYHAMANLYPDFARFEAEGTVFGSINKESFANLPLAVPSSEIVAAYERQASPLDEQINLLEQQSRTLATLRDTLLPKLLSGDVPVSGSAEDSA